MANRYLCQPILVKCLTSSSPTMSFKMPARRPLTSEQRHAAASPVTHAFIVAAPGSGKTTVAAERYGIHRFLDGQPGLRTLGLSFARSATQELRHRVQGRWGAQAITWPHEIQTLDSLLYELIRHLLVTGAVRWPGGHTELVVLDTWRGQTGARYLLAEQGWRRVAALNGDSVGSTGSRITHGAWYRSQEGLRSAARSWRVHTRRYSRRPAGGAEQRQAAYASC